MITGGRLHIWKTIIKMIQKLRNGYHLASIIPHGLKLTFAYFIFRKNITKIKGITKTPNEKFYEL